MGCLGGTSWRGDWGKRWGHIDPGKKKGGGEGPPFLCRAFRKKKIIAYERPCTFRAVRWEGGTDAHLRQLLSKKEKRVNPRPQREVQTGEKHNENREKVVPESLGI